MNRRWFFGTLLTAIAVGAVLDLTVEETGAGLQASATGNMTISFDIPEQPEAEAAQTEAIPKIADVPAEVLPTPEVQTVPEPALESIVEPQPEPAAQEEPAQSAEEVQEATLPAPLSPEPVEQIHEEQVPQPVPAGPEPVPAATPPSEEEVVTSTPAAPEPEAAEPQLPEEATQEAQPLEQPVETAIEPEVTSEALPVPTDETLPTTESEEEVTDGQVTP